MPAAPDRQTIADWSQIAARGLDATNENQLRVTNQMFLAQIIG